MDLGDMSVGADPEELFICPYDKAHIIRKKIIPYHLMKCRKNWTGKEYRTCPFNSNHEVPAPEFAGHMQMCEDKHIIDQDLEIMKKKEMVPIKRPEPDTKPESTEDWDRDIRVEQKLNRVRPPSHFVFAQAADLSTELHPYFNSKDVSASVSNRKPTNRIDGTDTLYHGPREPTTVSMAFGDGRGRRDDLLSTRSQNTSLDLTNEGDFRGMHASYYRERSLHPASGPRLSQSAVAGSTASSAAPTPPPFQPLGRGAFSAAVLQTIAMNPGAIANGNRSIDDTLENSRSSGFGVGLRSNERGIGSNGRNSRDVSYERPSNGSFAPSTVTRGATAVEHGKGYGDQPFAQSMGRGQFLRRY